MTLKTPKINQDQLLAYIRIGYALFSLIFLVQSYKIREFVWPDTQISSGAMLALFVLTVVSTLLLFFRKTSRVGALSSFVFLTVLFEYIPWGETVEDMFYQNVAFWMIFLPHGSLKSNGQDSSPFDRCGSVSIFLLGLNHGINFFMAGLTKALDPLWINGLGFESTLMLRWIKTPWSESLLEFPVVLEFLNYISIGFELAFLPLFLFKKTRLIAAGLALFFFTSLTYPFQIGFIGPFGLIISGYLFIRLTRSKKGEKTSTKERVLDGAIIGIPSIPIVIGLAVIAIQTPKNIHYPLTFYPINYTDSKAVGGEYDFVNPLRKYPSITKLNKLNLWTTRIKFMALFNSQHSYGVMMFRVIGETTSGEVVESVEIFTEKGWAGAYSAGLQPRWLQSRMYRFSYLAWKCNLGQPPEPTSYDRNLLKHLAQLTRRKSTHAQEVVKLKILVAKCNYIDPGKRTQIATDPDWEHLLTYDIDTPNIVFQAVSIDVPTISIGDEVISISP